MKVMQRKAIKKPERTWLESNAAGADLGH